MFIEVYFIDEFPPVSLLVNDIIAIVLLYSLYVALNISLRITFTVVSGIQFTSDKFSKHSIPGFGYQEKHNFS